MATPSTIEEIQTYKAQLNDFLSKKYIDQSLLLGFNNVLQSKFQTLILSDCNDYYDNLKAFDSQPEKDMPNNQIDLEFKTIKLFEILWTEFHYPIIKFFQFHHASYYNDFSKRVLDSNGKDKSLRAVEIRIINDNFIKFTKQVYQFYFTLLKHFSTHFHNPLVPKSLLNHFSFTIPNNAIKTTFNVNLQANLIFLIHRCLLSLGDISRHRSFIDLSYVKPCLSMKNFWKFYHMANLSSTEKSLIMRPLYDKALSFYKFCILLLPALNEPYNHIGMIYNLMDSKYEACYWFLRSQFTRLPNYKLGLTNLNTILKKDWFRSNLIDIYSPNKRSKLSLSKREEFNVSFICLICYYYLPEYYHKHNNSVIKNIKYSKIEDDFFRSMLHSFEELSQNYDEDNLNPFVKQLVILMSFNKLVELHNDKAASEQFLKFTFRYINKLLDVFVASKLDTNNKTTALVILRLLSNWFKENKIILRNFQARKNVMICMVTLVNRMLTDIYDLLSEIQGMNREEIGNLIKLNSRPTRDYYFIEDVSFRDFLIIKFQLKDFKDDHIFVSNNINLLVGDYSDLINKTTQVPSFFDNNLYKKIIDSNLEDASFTSLLDAEIPRYENDLRLKAVILITKKLLENNPYGIEFDYGDCKYSIKENTSEINDQIEVKDSQEGENNKRSKRINASKLDSKRKEGESNSKGKKQGRSKTGHTQQTEIAVGEAVSKEQPTMKIPNTLQELNSFILSHSSQLQDSLLQDPNGNTTVINSNSDDPSTQDPQREDGLKSMVESLVLESSNSEPKSTGSNTPNIWKNDAKNEVASVTPSQPVDMLNTTFATPGVQNDYSVFYGGAPPPPLMIHGPQVSANYSQVFLNPYPQYFNPFPNQFQAGSTPYSVGLNDTFIPASSQLLLSPIPPSLQRPQVPSSSPLPALAYPQYPQYYNQFVPVQQIHQQHPPPTLNGEQNSNQHRSHQ